jgi:hypothetical protein
MGGAISARTVTFDLARAMDDARKLSCSEFGEAVIGQITLGPWPEGRLRSRQVDPPPPASRSGRSKCQIVDRVTRFNLLLCGFSKPVIPWVHH